jgi:hypothetical protein
MGKSRLARFRQRIDKERVFYPVWKLFARWSADAIPALD